MARRMIATVIVLGLGLAAHVSAQAPRGDGVVTVPGPTGANGTSSSEPAPDPDNPGDQLFFAVQLAGKKGRRVIRAIREREHDVPAVITALRSTLRDGTEDLYIAYDVSLFNRCVFEQGAEGREALATARAACVGVRGIETKLGHFVVAPTPRGRAEDNGGEIRMIAELSLGVRASEGRDLTEQTFFAGLGRAPAVGSDTRMRVWVGTVTGNYEQAYGARAEFRPGTFNAQYGFVLTFLDEGLEEVDAFELDAGEDEAGVNTLNRTRFEPPTLTYTSAQRRLAVAFQGRTHTLVYEPATDRFVAQRAATR